MSVVQTNVPLVTVFVARVCYLLYSAESCASRTVWMSRVMNENQRSVSRNNHRPNIL